MSLTKDLLNKYTQHQLRLAYERWWSMIDRCENPASPAYKNYGARGIKVCSRWRGENGLYHYIQDMGMPSKGQSLDRINNDLGYSPENCRWASRYEQRQNQRRVASRSLPSGVSYRKDPARKKQWLARLEVGGKRVLNKRCFTKEEAISARLAAEKEFL